MPVSVKPRDFRQAALRKGFVEDKKGDHIFYQYLNENGKINPRVKTKVSHGTGDISASNLGKMKTQLKFETMDQFMKYVECTFTLDEYRALLKKHNYE